MLKYYSRSKAPLDGSWTDWGPWSSCYSDCRLTVAVIISDYYTYCTLHIAEDSATFEAWFVA